MENANNVLEKLKLLEKSSDRYRGYWISPYGTVLDLKKYGKSHHVSAILKEPVKFGFSKEEIKDVMDKYEGDKVDAKEELVKAAVFKGWIRVRRYQSKGGYDWTVNVKRVNDKVKTLLNVFFTRYVEKYGRKQYDGTYYSSDQVYVDSPESRDFYTIMDIVRFKMWESLSEAKKEELLNKTLMWE